MLPTCHIYSSAIHAYKRITSLASQTRIQNIQSCLLPLRLPAVTEAAKRDLISLPAEMGLGKADPPIMLGNHILKSHPTRTGLVARVGFEPEHSCGKTNCKQFQGKQPRLHRPLQRKQQMLTGGRERGGGRELHNCCPRRNCHPIPPFLHHNTIKV